MLSGWNCPPERLGHPAVKFEPCYVSDAYQLYMPVVCLCKRNARMYGGQGMGMDTSIVDCLCHVRGWDGAGQSMLTLTLML